jgi:hypothetical protein
MATLAREPARFRRSARRHGKTLLRGHQGPRLIALWLLAITAYAVFAHGAIAAPAEPRIQVALEFACATAVALGLRLRLPRAAGGALALLVAFALWSAVTLAWSVSPEQTWLEFNRVVAYALITALALALGASLPRAVELTALGFLALVAVVTLYGLGQKLLPGLNVLGLIDLNQTGGVARLQEPLGYWNALALLLAMGAPVALATASRMTAARWLRLGALVVLQLILVAGTFTLSRGGVVALLVGLAIFLVMSADWLRATVWLGVAVLAALPPLAMGLVSSSLSADHVPLARRESAGLLLLVVLAGCGVVLVLGAERLLALEPSIRPSADLRRRLRTVLIAAGVAGVVLGALVLALSGRGLGGTLTHAVSNFTRTQAVSVSDPSRLLSDDSAYRWDWWKEALGAAAARPLGGWGAGSFPIVHLLFRHNDVPVTHAHSVPLEWLAETGLVGAALAVAAWVLLLRSGVSAVRRRVTPAGRMVAAGLLGAGFAYAVHALYDWDWDIPGVTLPALILLGVLAGSRGLSGGFRSVALEATGGRSALSRGLAAATAALAMVALALSSVLPSLASSRASTALLTASSGSPGALARAQHDAAVAASLDPLSDAGPSAEAYVAAHEGYLERVRAYLLQAVVREPSDENAWARLAVVDVQTGHLRAALGAADRLFGLDPFNRQFVVTAVTVAQQAELRLAPPRASATAIATP